MNKKDVHVGMKVTCKTPECAYYHDGTFRTLRGINPRIEFRPGDIGIVNAVNVPCVTRNKSFCCVDFVRDGKEYRCGLYYNNIKAIKEHEDRDATNEKKILTVEELFNIFDPDGSYRAKLDYIDKIFPLDD